MKQTPLLDLALLRSFVAIAETESITAAASVVGRSQGAVSQQLQRLEALFGCKLVDRSAAKLSLTSSGEKLLAKANRALLLNDEIVASMTDTDFAGEVRLGAAYDIVAAVLPEALRRFREARPDVRVHLTSDTSRGLMARLKNGEIDLALTTDRVDDGRGRMLFRERLVWVGAPDGLAYRAKPLTVALGDERCAFRSATIETLARAGLDWRPICQSGGLEAVQATLQADLAIAPFLKRTAPPGLAVLTSRRLPVLPEFHVVLREAARVKEPAVEALRTLLVECLP
ncbi:MAG: LysR substrate-binding domain-containing protein [Dongiaceae bacterium]